MFLFYFKYAILNNIRQKQSCFWSLIFPLILGTLFFAVFSNLMNLELLNKSLPVAVVSNNDEFTEDFLSIASEVILSDDMKMFDIKEVSIEEARELLNTGDIVGIFKIGEKVSVEVKASEIEQSIIGEFASIFNQVTYLIDDTLADDPSKLEAAINEMINSNRIYGSQETLTEGIMDTYGMYFYNLLAMCCLLASLSSVYIPIKNQGNLSDIGARKCISPKNRAAAMLADICAVTLLQLIFSLISFFYLKLLGVDFGEKTLMVILTLFVGVLSGVSLGYFCGSIGKFNQLTKEGMVSSISLAFCFFSGLMVINMRRVVDSIFPALNKINPAALISDSFFSLNMYSDYTRYFENIINLLIVSTIFLVLGLINTRRESYASI